MTTRLGNGRTLVVVFGAAVRADGSASPALARRTGYAAAVAEADPATDLFLSGGVGRHGAADATVMARLLSGAVAGSRLFLDTASLDTLQTVRAAAAFATTHGYARILTCTDAYHQPRVGMLFRLFGHRSRPVQLASRGGRRLRTRMWLREGAAIPYDLVAGLAARVQASRRGN